MKRRSLGGAVLVLGLLVGAVGGCAPPAAQIRVTSPFTPELARFFDDAVDYVQDANGLGGRLASEWNTQIQGLTNNADLIGVARIETVIQGQDSDGTQSYRLAAVLTSRLLGTPPEENRVSLRVSAGQVGFNTVAGKERRLQSGQYFVFVKWYQDGAGTIRAHWHLTPYSDAIRDRIREIAGLINVDHTQETVVRSSGN